MSGDTRPDQPVPSTRAGNLTLRIISALVLGPLALICVWFGDLWFAALLAVVSVAGGGEWRKMIGLASRGVGSILILGSLFIVVIGAEASPAAGIFALLVVVGLAVSAFGTPWSDRRWTVTGVLYIGIASLALLYLRETPLVGRELVFLLFGAVWLSDIGGYVAGRLIGGPRLAPAISPNKTWSGALGAVVFVTIGVVGLVWVTSVPPEPFLLMGVLLSIATQCGDLFESWVKRRFGVKDSGTLIPGHGGVLDRVDGVLFAAPVLAAFVLFFGAGLLQWQ